MFIMIRLVLVVGGSEDACLGNTYHLPSTRNSLKTPVFYNIINRPTFTKFSLRVLVRVHLDSVHEVTAVQFALSIYFPESDSRI